MKRRMIEIKSIKTSFVIGFVCLLLLSCSKTKGGGGSDDDDHHVGVDENDTSFPVIRIDSPVPDQVYINGDTIRVEGLIKDNGLYKGK